MYFSEAFINTLKADDLKKLGSLMDIIYEASENYDDSQKSPADKRKFVEKTSDAYLKIVTFGVTKGWDVHKFAKISDALYEVYNSIFETVFEDIKKQRPAKDQKDALINAIKSSNLSQEAKDRLINNPGVQCLGGGRIGGSRFYSEAEHIVSDAQLAWDTWILASFIDKSQNSTDAREDLFSQLKAVCGAGTLIRVFIIYTQRLREAIELKVQ